MMKKVILLLYFLIFCLTLNLSGSWAGESKKVAIIPFKVNGPQDMSYLQDGIFDMLASRLADKEVTVIEKQTVKNALEGAALASINESLARDIGNRLKADYVIFGSMTILGASSSLDARLVAVNAGESPISLYSQAKSPDEVIPRIIEFAETINAKLFGKEKAAAAVTAAPSKSGAALAAHPERILLSGKGASPEETRNVKQKITTDKKEEFWKAQDFPMVMRGMAVGDIDRDGNREAVIISDTDIWMYRLNGEKLNEIKHIKGKATFSQLSVDIADINNNGVPEIYVTNLAGGNLNSFALEWNGADYARVDHLPWYLRVVVIGDKRLLVGQKKTANAIFDPAIYIMEWQQKQLKPGKPLKLPVSANVFNFAEIDLDGDKALETLMIDDSNKLKVFSVNGELKWKSDEPYGETMNYVVINPERTRDQTEERYYLPCRIAVLNDGKDNQPFLFINRNLSTASRFLRNFREYTNSEINMLSWDGLGLAEKWKTKKISGSVCDYELIPDGNGQYQLLVGLILRTGIAPVVSGKSTIIGYALEK